MFAHPLLPLDWEPRRRATLVYVVEGDRVLLMEKLRGHGTNLVNAPGGKLERDETPSACADRELFEEVGLRAYKKTLHGLLRFYDEVNGYSMFGYVYVCTRFAGRPSKSDEADPFWCEIEKAPYERMWGGDRVWLPFILAGEYLSADLIFAADRFKDWSMELHDSDSELQAYVTSQRSPVTCAFL